MTCNIKCECGYSGKVDCDAPNICPQCGQSVVATECVIDANASEDGWEKFAQRQGYIPTPSDFQPSGYCG